MLVMPEGPLPDGPGPGADSGPVVLWPGGGAGLVSARLSSAGIRENRLSH